MSAATSPCTRRLSGHSGRKTDGFDARAVAIIGANHTRLRQVGSDDAPAELRVLLAGRWHLVSRRQQVICRLDARLTELAEDGAKKALSVKRASAALRRIRTDNPADAARRQAPSPHRSRGDGQPFHAQRIRPRTRS